MLKEREKKPVHPLNESDIIYMIMTDRYPGGNPDNNGVWGAEYRPGQLKYRQGGDFLGIIGKMGYLKNLGITAIWISPPQENEYRNKLYEGTAYHGYHTHDYFSIDKHFGTREELQELIDTAHACGIKVILDAVPNHTADYLDSFTTEYNPAYPRDFRPAPPFNNPAWYHHNGDTVHWDDQWELENTDIGGLDGLDHDKKEVREALFRAYAKLAGMGFDGVRIDAATSIPKWFLQEFERNAGIPAFGETYNKDVAYVSDYQKYLWGVLDFPLFFALVDVFASDQDFSAIQHVLAQDSMYQDPKRVVTFLDNHDRNRFLCVAQDDYRKLFLGLDFIFTARGIPDVYYGTEQGFYNGGSNGVAVTDSIVDWQNREVMDTFDETGPIFRHIRRLADIRKGNPVLAYGQQLELYCDSQIYCFARVRKEEKEIIISVFNNGYGSKTVLIPLSGINFIKVGAVFTDLLDTSYRGEIYSDSSGNLFMGVTLQAKAARVMTRNRKIEPYVSEQLVETHIIVNYSGVPSDTISLRGNPYPLWEDRGRMMRRAGSSKWEFSIYRIPENGSLEFRPVLNNLILAEDKYIVYGGQTLEINPSFISL